MGYKNKFAIEKIIISKNSECIPKWNRYTFLEQKQRFQVAMW